MLAKICVFFLATESKKCVFVWVGVGIPQEDAARVSEGGVLIPEVVSDAAALTSGRGASSSCREKQKRFQREQP